MKNLFLFLFFFNTLVMAQEPITIQVEKDAKSVCEVSAKILLNETLTARRENKSLSIILPTGSTPNPMYETLVKWFYEGKIDFSKVHFFHLDEYANLNPENPNSYAYFLKSHLFNLISPGLNKEKLAYFGLHALSKKDCFNKKTRLKLNKTIDRFIDSLIEYHKESPNALQALEDCVENFKKNDRSFLTLFSEYMNDRSLPSYESLKAFIEKDISLKTLSAQKNHIHLMNGSNKPETEILRYQSLLRKEREKPNSRMICFCGVGKNPPHIAFNEFVTEEFFLDESKTEEEKNKAALKSKMRLVPLASGTIEANARFFNDNKNLVPTHAITLGLSELNHCDRIIAMAYGEEKKDPLYLAFSKPPSYRASISLLKKNLFFIIDRKAYGIAEKNSLFSLNTLDQLKANHHHLKVKYCEDKDMPFWQIPTIQRASLLHKGYQIENKSISLAHVPQNQKVLWIKEGRIHYSLWQELKDAKNKIYISPKTDVKSIISQVDKYDPDIIILPYSHEIIDNYKELKTEIKKRYSEKPILGIFYETSEMLTNVFFPISKEELKHKVEAIQKFHYSQVSRTKFDLVAEEMTNLQSPLSSLNERYHFFSLKKENKKMKLTPFTEKLYITKSYQKDKKQSKLLPFTFDQKDTVVFISPHPDDAEISAGVLINHLGKENVKTYILNVTSGQNCVIKKDDLLKHPYLPDSILKEAKCELSEFIESPTLKARIRECESLGAISHLNPQATVKNLKLPFYTTGKYSLNDRRICDQTIQSIVKNQNRIFFFLPFPQDKQNTHKLVHQLFMERICKLYKSNSDLDIVIAFYPTPWTGNWNMYDYSYNQGSKFAALTGSEILTGNGQIPPKTESLGGTLARRYQLFYLND